MIWTTSSVVSGPLPGQAVVAVWADLDFLEQTPILNCQSQAAGSQIDALSPGLAVEIRLSRLNLGGPEA